MSHRLAAALAAALVLAVPGCGGGDDPSSSSSSSKDATQSGSGGSGSTASGSGATQVSGGRATVKMSEFKFDPKALSAPAGTLRLTAQNVGNAPHELVVVKTDKPAGSLPVSGGKASEAGAVGEIGEQQPGQTGSHTFKLKPGKYVMVCNIAGHYSAGMYGTLVVK